MKKVTPLFVLLMILYLIGCTCEGKPDLKPGKRVATNTGLENYCQAEPGTPGLKVVIQNKGDVDSPASTTRVEFPGLSQTYSTDLATPAIPAKGETFLIFPYPSGENCFNSDCDFIITVDVNDVVDECYESNNEEAGLCIG